VAATTVGAIVPAATAAVAVAVPAAAAAAVVAVPAVAVPAAVVGAGGVAAAHPPARDSRAQTANQRGTRSSAELATTRYFQSVTTWRSSPSRARDRVPTAARTRWSGTNTPLATWTTSSMAIADMAASRCDSGWGG